MKLSIDQNKMADTHRVGFNSPHYSKSEFNFSSKEVIKLVESLGYTALNYTEQAYNRTEENRTGKGYYTVNFKSNNFKDVGICLIDAKDGQSSLKLFIGVFILDKVFPLFQFENIKHSKFEKTKILNLPERIENNLKAVENSLNLILSTLKDIKVNTTKLNNISEKAYFARCTHPNYRKGLIGGSFTFETATSGSDALKVLLASYCDVNWPRHLVTLSSQIGDQIITEILK
jgi:hypothetical protein